MKKVIDYAIWIFGITATLTVIACTSQDPRHVKQTNYGYVSCRNNGDISICEFKTKNSRFCEHAQSNATTNVDCAIYDDMVK